MVKLKFIGGFLALQFLIAVTPNHVNAQEISGNFSMMTEYYFFLQDYKEALPLYQSLYQIDSTNANVLVELGTFYNVLQEKNKALAFFRKAVYYDASNYYYNMMLAGLSKELGLKQEVVDIYSAMSKLYPDKPDLQFELANAYADNGELQKAIDTFNKLEKSTGIAEIITLNKYRLYTQMNKKKRAFDEIQQIIDKIRMTPAI